MRLNKLFAAAAVLMFPAIASADPCSGAPPFTDVSALANYCTNTEWLKNRNVTLGCVGTNYCPNDVVTRGSMALFMNRLGQALTPTNLYAEGGPGALDITTDQYVCQTPDFAVTGFPRVAVASSGLTATSNAAATLTFAGDIWYSTDAGVSWNFISQFVPRATSNSTSEWATITHAVTLNLAVGTTYRFAVDANRRGGTATGFGDSRCYLHVSIENRNSATSPFDQPAPTPSVDR